MSTAATKQRLTPEEYLAIENASEDKSEYYDGEMYAMSGGSFTHSVIAANIGGELYNRLRGGSCRPLSSDMRVQVPSTHLYTYPDVSVVCGAPQFAANSANTLINPILVAEVLSPSTEGYDRTTKFWHYQKIETLRDYILAAQDTPRVEHFFRQTGSQLPEPWLYTVYEGLDTILRLPSLNIELPLRAIYGHVSFEKPPESPADDSDRPRSPIL